MTAFVLVHFRSPVACSFISFSTSFLVIAFDPSQDLLIPLYSFFIFTMAEYKGTFINKNPLSRMPMNDLVR